METKYSINETTQGRPVAVVDTDILAGVPESKWVKTVKATLEKLYPNGIKIGNNDILITTRTADEFTRSRSAQALARKSKDAYADKLRTASIASDVLKASTDYVNEAPKHPRKDNFVDFGRGKVLLQIGSNSYSADVIVGYTNKGEMELYDLVNITPDSFTLKASLNDKTNNTERLIPSADASDSQQGATYDNSMPDSTQNVKKNFSLNDNTGRELSNAQQYMFSIAEGMSDIERYNELKDAKLLVKDYSASDVEHLTEAEVRALEDKVKRNVRKSVKKLVEKFGVIKHYSNSNANIEFNFSKNGASESINKQGERSGDFLSMGKMFASFDSIVESAVPIEIHGDKYKGTIREDPGLKRVYVLVSAYYDNGIVPVQLEVKEFSVDRESQLYVAVTAKKIEADVIVPGLRQNAAPGTVTSFDVSIADILSEINPSDGDFLKYVPDQFLSDAQKASKKEALNIERDIFLLTFCLFSAILPLEESSCTVPSALCT